MLDDTFVIDLKAMNGVVVDPDRRRALVEGGAIWRLVDRESQLHGLALTGGTVSDTGVAGLTLGGGVGWLMRRAGVTLDSLVALSAVTADGEPIRISAEDEPELFWECVVPEPTSPSLRPSSSTCTRSDPRSWRHGHPPRGRCRGRDPPLARLHGSGARWRRVDAAGHEGGGAAVSAGIRRQAGGRILSRARRRG